MSNPCSSTMTGPSPPLSSYSIVPAESSVSCLVIPCGLPLLSNAAVPASSSSAPFDRFCGLPDQIVLACGSRSRRGRPQNRTEVF